MRKFRLICKSAIVILIWNGSSALATVYDSDGSAADVQRIHDTLAADGDTITIPAGTFRWTSRLNITKGITLQGQTTIGGAGTANPIISDATIIQDDTPRSGSGQGIITAQMNANQSFRLTGITFSPGTNSTYSDHAIQLLSQDTSPNTFTRVDHCHFTSLWQSHLVLAIGWIYGVADHNVMECRAAALSFLIWHNLWGRQTNGYGSWADYPYYGTEKFFFVETNTIIGAGVNTTSGGLDCMNGGRFVARYNYFKNAKPGGHGDEGGPQHGQRACEVYNNTIEWTIQGGVQQLRSGTTIWHDNLRIGVAQDQNLHTSMAIFRAIGAIGNNLSYWGLAGGQNPWDVNDPRGLYESGATTSYVGSGTLIDNAKQWTPNRWAGYSVTNTNPASAAYLHSSFIISNTSNTITYYFYSAGDRGAPLLFNAGDSYEIYRVLVAMGQGGQGKGDLIAGDPPVNTLTGIQSWPHNALEPMFSWNNRDVQGHVLNIGSNTYPTEIANRDFYNLGAGFTGTPQQ